MEKKKVTVIGAGFGGLSCAGYLAKNGFEVTIIEKNNWVGGRAQVWKDKGFSFDMGPSWYWMPEVFEQFFGDLGQKRDGYFKIQRLSPSYRIYFENGIIDLPSGRKEMVALFETIEKGAGAKLEELLNKTENVYTIAMRTFVNRSYNVKNLLDWKLVIEGVKLLSNYNGLRSVETFLRSYFVDERLLKILSFPIFFLGESTKHIPAVYSLMNHVDIDLGTWYPIGGFSKVAESMAQVVTKLGVKIFLNKEVEQMMVTDKNITKIMVKDGTIYTTDLVVANGDYHQTDQVLLSNSYRQYTQTYWGRKKLAPSSLLVYLGLSKKLKGLLHHSLFFQHSWKDHNKALFEDKVWPEKPLYYVHCPTKTEPGLLAPKGGEIVILLVPLAAGIVDSEKSRIKMRDFLIDDLEKTLGETIKKYIVTERVYALDDFTADYNAYKGNAYGLGQTLDQTAIFRPSHRSNKLNNLFYTGQFTVPGTGVPMVIISGKVVADEIRKCF